MGGARGGVEDDARRVAESVVDRRLERRRLLAVGAEAASVLGRVFTAGDEAMATDYAAPGAGGWV